MDSLRTPDLGTDFQDAVDQKIIDVKLPRKGQQTIKLLLENGKTLWRCSVFEIFAVNWSAVDSSNAPLVGLTFEYSRPESLENSASVL